MSARVRGLRTSAHVDFSASERVGARRHERSDRRGARDLDPSGCPVRHVVKGRFQGCARLAKLLRTAAACLSRRLVETLSTVNEVRTDWGLSLDELAALAPASNIRHGVGTRGEVVSVGIGDLSPEDVGTVRALYGMIGALYEVVTPLVEEGLAAVPAVRSCAEANGFATLASRVSALGKGLDADTVSPLVRKALHDIRGGGLPALMMHLEALLADEVEADDIRRIFLLCRDQRKIVRNAIPDLDPAGYAHDLEPRAHTTELLTQVVDRELPRPRPQRGAPAALRLRRSDLRVLHGVRGARPRRLQPRQQRGPLHRRRARRAVGVRDPPGRRDGPAVRGDQPHRSGASAGASTRTSAASCRACSAAATPPAARGSACASAPTWCATATSCPRCGWRSTAGISAPASSAISSRRGSTGRRGGSRHVSPPRRGCV
jgi:hypothetical protein